MAGVRDKRKNQRGMALMEILVATLIALIAIGGILEAYCYFSVLAESTEESYTAMGNLATMMEKIQSTSFSLVETRFPNGTMDGGGITDYSAIVGGYSLSNEHITVNYVNPGTNPLEVIITVQWDGPKGRPYVKSLSTFKTD